MLPDRFHWPVGTSRCAALATLAVLVAGLAGCATALPAGAPASTAAATPPTPSTPPTAAPAGLAAPAAPSCGPAGAAPGGSLPPVSTPSRLDAGIAAPPACTPATTIHPTDARTLGFLLAYAERLHRLSPAELAAQITALGDPGQQPMGLMQLALALTHTHQSVDTARALGLFQRVIAQTGTAAEPYKPLARLLAGRLTDQRRLEEAVDRQAQQLREQQRRIEQLADRLEAMRAIERSLLPRPGAAPAARSPRPATP